MKGVVFRSTGSWYEIFGEDGIVYKGRLRGNFKLKELKLTNPIAVGDEVEFEKEGEEGSVFITGILARRNYLIRKSVHKKGHGHLIAANLDQTALVATLVFPKTSLGFIDRFLISAEAFRIPAVIVFNKNDLYTEGLKEYEQELFTIYEKLGYKCLSTSTLTEGGMQGLREELLGKKTLFSGHSGAGKSTLINKLLPGLDLKTSEISSFANKGVHTTTFAEMFRYNEDTLLIDTPGIKELGLFEFKNEELSHYFPEMRALLGQCKFHNCMHVNEPGCAVQQKVREGGIALSRFQSYLSILADEETHR